MSRAWANVSKNLEAKIIYGIPNRRAEGLKIKKRRNVMAISAHSARSGEKSTKITVHKVFFALAFFPQYIEFKNRTNFPVCGIFTASPKPLTLIYGRPIQARSLSMPFPFLLARPAPFSLSPILTLHFRQTSGARILCLTLRYLFPSA